jgi:hypothetical protein
MFLICHICTHFKTKHTICLYVNNWNKSFYQTFLNSYHYYARMNTNSPVFIDPVFVKTWSINSGNCDLIDGKFQKTSIPENYSDVPAFWNNTDCDLSCRNSVLKWFNFLIIIFNLHYVSKIQAKSQNFILIISLHIWYLYKKYLSVYSKVHTIRKLFDGFSPISHI